MSRSLRSVRGCWTCRLRRKKCDETHPICLLCDSLVIPCYGYGPKPDWMDGGEIEKTKLESFKKTVKHTSRQRGRPTQHSSLTSDSNQEAINTNLIQSTVFERSLDLSDAVPANANRAHDPATLRCTFDQSSEALQLDSSSTNGLHSSTTELNASSITQSQAPAVGANLSSNMQGNDAKFLMYFLDYVFPLQFPMYKPTAQEGGRGWLLSLVIHTNPLYHAALGLSAFHQQVMMFPATPKDHNRNDLEEQQALCLQRLQSEILRLDQWAGSGIACPKRGVGVLASMIQLIFIESIVNETDNWRLHLTAAIGMVDRLYTKREIRGLSESELNAHVDIQTAIRLGWDRPRENTNPEHPLVEEQTAVKFLTGVTIYLDVISCVTLSRCSRLSNIHNDLIGPSSNEIQLQGIFGCENWVILLISKISSLQAAKKCHTGAMIEDYQIFDIKESLDLGIHFNSEFIKRLKCDNDYTLSHASSIRVITHVYALASLIYLQIMVTGAQDNCLDVRTNVASIIKVLGLVTNTEVARNLKWPMYIAGSVSIGSERGFFRTFSTRVSSCSSTSEYSRLLAKLEDIWRNKDANASGPHGSIYFSDLQCSSLLLL